MTSIYVNFSLPLCRPLGPVIIDNGSYSSKTLILSLLKVTQEAFVESIDQDQTAQNLQSDL